MLCACFAVLLASICSMAVDIVKGAGPELSTAANTTSVVIDRARETLSNGTFTPQAYQAIAGCPMDCINLGALAVCLKMESSSV